MKTAVAHLARAQTGRQSANVTMRSSTFKALHSSAAFRSSSILSAKQTAHGHRCLNHPTLRLVSTHAPRCNFPLGLSILEVERKFAPTPASILLLTTNAGQPAFESLTDQGSSEFQDIYYDTPESHLSKAGVWVRCRGDAWEAKVRVGGDLTNSAFEEITNVDEISELLGKLVPGAKLEAARGPYGGDLQQLAKFVSYRKKFLVNNRLTVVLDSTDFGHVVGEVELERVLPALAVDADADEQVQASGNKAAVVAEMDSEIDEFMKLHDWAFPPGKPVGKLSAYFALQRKP